MGGRVMSGDELCYRVLAPAVERGHSGDVTHETHSIQTPRCRNGSPAAARRSAQRGGIERCDGQVKGELCTLCGESIATEEG